VEHVAQVAQVGVAQFLEAADADALALQGRAHLAGQAVVLGGDELVDDLADALHLHPRRHAVGPGAEGDAGLDLLLDAADADHEEFVQVGAEDGQELEALQQRDLRILGLLQDTAVKL